MYARAINQWRSQDYTKVGGGGKYKLNYKILEFLLGLLLLLGACTQRITNVVIFTVGTRINKV